MKAFRGKAITAGPALILQAIHRTSLEVDDPSIAMSIRDMCVGETSAVQQQRDAVVRLNALRQLYAGEQPRDLINRIEERRKSMQNCGRRK